MLLKRKLRNWSSQCRMLEAQVLEKEEAASHVIKNREASIEGSTEEST